MKITSTELLARMERAKYAYMEYGTDKLIMLKSRTSEVSLFIAPEKIDMLKSISFIYDETNTEYNGESISPSNSDELRIMKQFIINNLRCGNKIKTDSMYGTFGNKDNYINVTNTETGEILKYSPYWNTLGVIPVPDSVKRPHIELGVYNHFKGKLYRVIGVAMNVEWVDDTIKTIPYVIYEAMYGDNKSYARPYDMFVSDVDKEKYPDVIQKERFRFISK